MSDFAQNRWVWAILFAIVTLGCGALSALRRKKLHESKRSRAELYRYAGGTCFMIAMLPLGYLASGFIDLEALWKKLAIGTGIVGAGVAGIFALWGWNIIRKNKFDINDTNKTISLIGFGLYAGLSVPALKQLLISLIAGGSAK